MAYDDTLIRKYGDVLQQQYDEALERLKEHPEEGYVDDNGDIVHVLEDGELAREIFMVKYLYCGEEWCPSCHIKAKDMGDYFLCEKCGYSITKEESENREGYPSLLASYDADIYDTFNVYDENYDDDDEDYCYEGDDDEDEDGSYDDYW